MHSDVEWDRPTGNIYYLYGLEAAAAFLLAIACINHVNLATAGAARRAREIGTRKILGATRTALALRFIAESLALSVAALFVALLVVELVVPRTPIADWLGAATPLRPTSEPVVLAAAIGFTALVGLVAGLYPALYLAAIPPLTALTRGDRVGSGLRLRELLVLVQFTVTACVIACTLLMTAQMSYVANRPLGFEETGKLVVTLRGTDVLERIPTVEDELLGDDRIRGATSANQPPVRCSVVTYRTLIRAGICPHIFGADRLAEKSGAVLVADMADSENGRRLGRWTVAVPHAAVNVAVDSNKLVPVIQSTRLPFPC